MFLEAIMVLVAGINLYLVKEVSEIKSNVAVLLADYKRGCK